MADEEAAPARVSAFLSSARSLLEILEGMDDDRDGERDGEQVDEVQIAELRARLAVATETARMGEEEERDGEGKDILKQIERVEAQLKTVERGLDNCGNETHEIVASALKGHDFILDDTTKEIDGDER